MVELPTGYMVRTPAPSDAGAIAHVVQALDVADFGEPDFTEQDLLDDWLRPRFDLETDAWVLSGPTGRVIGYGYVWEVLVDREIEADAYVLPEYSGRGLGSQLLDLVETRAREVCHGRSMSLGVFASSANEDKRSLLERRGFRPVRSMLRMRIDLGQVSPADAPAPAGIEIRPFVSADEGALRSVWRDAFADHGRFSSRGMEEWLQSRFDHPAFDPALWRVAVDGDEIVGAILVFDVGQTGYTSSVGVRSSHRGRGIGPALLRAAFGALRARGQMRVIVALDDDAESGLLSVYESAGMRLHERHDLFSKPLA